MEATLSPLFSHSARTFICSSCLRRLRNGSPRPRLQKTLRIQHRLKSTKSHIAKPGEQANPLYGYYEDLLSQMKAAQSLQNQAQTSTPTIIPSAARTTPSPPPPTELPKTDREEVLQRARIVFGSRLAGPAERQRQRQDKSVNVAGILVPPKPEEPDNCCMSGCVNCVWDTYRDELEDWAAKSALARERVLAQRQKARMKRDGLAGTGMMKAQPGTPAHVATSMDDDGGGSETNWATGLEMGERQADLFENIPVGIREFMKTEKMLKERHRHEAEARA